MKELKKLFEPIKIGTMTVKNRMVMAPMNTNFTTHDGAVTPQFTNYLIRRAKGGVGLIVVEATAIVPDVKTTIAQPMLYDRSFIPSWGNLIEKLHHYGTKVSIELQHSGLEVAAGPKVSASDVSSCEEEGLVIPLTIAGIEDLEDKFAKASGYAKAAGFDAITWHAAHGYIITQFMSPVYNKRTDAYGGSLRNRMRFLLEIIKKGKKVVGDDFPMMVRFSADEYIEGGITLEESKEIAKYLEKAGVHALDISAGVADCPFMLIPYGLPGGAGSLIHLAEGIKKVVNIPVIGVGGIRDPLFAEEILTSGKADMVALGRALIADPEFCRKTKEGNSEDIRKCIACEYCLTTLLGDLSMRCAVNPEVGREEEFEVMKRSTNLKKVLIVGAGPGGMEAARIARLRGHTVMLFEKESELGGQLNVAKIPPYKKGLGDLIGWFSRQLVNLGVELKLNTEVTPEVVEEIAPDVVILATGSVFGHKLPGSDKKHVMTAADVLQDTEKVGKNVVVIGGGETGCETAEYLSGSRIELHFEKMKELGSINLIYKKKSRSGVRVRKVTIVEIMSEVASDLDMWNRPLLLYRLKENGVKVMIDTKAEEITDEGVKVINTKTLERTIIEADVVVLAQGLEANNSLAAFLAGKVSELYIVGDCKKPRKIVDAIYEGYYLACRI